MPIPHLSLIVAMSENRVIGRGGQLPWHLSADLRRFKRLTVGHCLLMGRKTYESIGRLLPGRRTIVITRQADFVVPGGCVARDLPEAIGLAGSDSQAFVVGGSQIYQQALPMVDTLRVTRVHAQVEGDVLFPEVCWEQWQLIEQQRFTADSQNDYDYSFCLYQRRQALSVVPISGAADGEG